MYSLNQLKEESLPPNMPPVLCFILSADHPTLLPDPESLIRYSCSISGPVMPPRGDLQHHFLARAFLGITEDLHNHAEIISEYKQRDRHLSINSRAMDPVIRLISMAKLQWRPFLECAEWNFRPNELVNDGDVCV